MASTVISSQTPMELFLQEEIHNIRRSMNYDICNPQECIEFEKARLLVFYRLVQKSKLGCLKALENFNRKGVELLEFIATNEGEVHCGVEFVGANEGNVDCDVNSKNEDAVKSFASSSNKQSENLRQIAKVLKLQYDNFLFLYSEVFHEPMNTSDLNMCE